MSAISNLVCQPETAIASSSLLMLGLLLVAVPSKPLVAAKALAKKDRASMLFLASMRDVMCPEPNA